MKIKEFISEWKEVRGKTYEFLDNLPKDKINWRPHRELGTFGMQIRHMCISQKAYMNGIKSGKVDFDDKNFDADLEHNKSKVIKHLKQLDKELINLLKSVDNDKSIEFHDGVYGLKIVPVGTVLAWMLQHETYHQGIFTCYGRLAELGKFRFM